MVSAFLSPRDERKVLAAATWVNVKFPIRAPSHLAALRGFIVGHQATGLLHAPDADIIDSFARISRAGWARASQPLFSTIHRWPDSMPQYVVGHSERRAESPLAGTIPRTVSAGNAYDGVGIPDCIRGAQEISKQVIDRRV